MRAEAFLGSHLSYSWASRGLGSSQASLDPECPLHQYCDLETMLLLGQYLLYLPECCLPVPGDWEQRPGSIYAALTDTQLALSTCPATRDMANPSPNSRLREELMRGSGPW